MLDNTQNQFRTKNRHSISNRCGDNGKKVTLKNCALFTDCFSEINNTQIDNAKDIDIVIPMYHLIEYSNNYSKTPAQKLTTKTS